MLSFSLTVVSTTRLLDVLEDRLTAVDTTGLLDMLEDRLTAVDTTKLLNMLEDRPTAVDTIGVPVQFTLAISSFSQQYVRLCLQSIISSSEPEHWYSPPITGMNSEKLLAVYITAGIASTRWIYRSHVTRY